MVREPDATTQPTLQDNQLMSKHRVLSFKPQRRLEWRGQDGQNETEQPDHSASLGDSITSSIQIRFSVHTAAAGTSPARDRMGRSRLMRRCRDCDKQKTAPLPAPFLVHLRVEPAHFDWRWRERPALALLAWEAVARDPRRGYAGFQSSQLERQLILGWRHRSKSAFRIQA